MDIRTYYYHIFTQMLGADSHNHADTQGSGLAQYCKQVKIKTECEYFKN
jgi:hypothetical protein